ncbi:MAG: hypothetical protein SH809_03480 [Rhodothermales bacterium]|nr:hypothetical protein [Rhodothermales bacterium]
MKYCNYILALVLLMIGAQLMPANAQEFRTRYQKPQRTFLYIQGNLHAGSDTKEPGSQIDDKSYRGFSSRGPATQVSFELFSRMERRIQTGYTRHIMPNAWNAKFFVQASPISNENWQDVGLSLRLDNTWVNFSTKWDRTQFRVGHQSIPFGHNPRIDGNMSFLPNQSGTDIGLGTDTGIMLRTGLSPLLDIEVAATAGGFLSGPLLSGNMAEGQDLTVDHAIKYRGSWLGTAHVGTPTFYRNEFGVFAAIGRLHRFTGAMPFVGRIGANWIVKGRESWKLVNQVNMGFNNPNVPEQNTFAVFNVLNSVELFAHAFLRFGVTNVWRFEDRSLSDGSHPIGGTLLGSLSIPITRTSRLRINPFLEYVDTAGKLDQGVMFQVCMNCGLIK